MLPSPAELRERSRFYGDAARDATETDTKDRRIDCAFVLALVALFRGRRERFRYLRQRHSRKARARDRGHSGTIPGQAGRSVGPKAANPVASGVPALAFHLLSPCARSPLPLPAPKRSGI